MKLLGGAIIQFCQFPVYSGDPGLQVLFEFYTKICFQWISFRSKKNDRYYLNVESGKSTVVSNSQRPSAIS